MDESAIWSSGKCFLGHLLGKTHNADFSLRSVTKTKANYTLQFFLLRSYGEIL